MIKRLKKCCYIVVCDYCGEDVFGYDYISHFETKEEVCTISIIFVLLNAGGIG